MQLVSQLSPTRPPPSPTVGGSSGEGDGTGGCRWGPECCAPGNTGLRVGNVEEVSGPRKCVGWISRTWNPRL